MERFLRVNLLGTGPHLIKIIYRAAVSQRLRNTALEGLSFLCEVLLITLRHTTLSTTPPDE